MDWVLIIFATVAVEARQNTYLKFNLLASTALYLKQMPRTDPARSLLLVSRMRHVLKKILERSTPTLCHFPQLLCRNAVWKRERVRVEVLYTTLKSDQLNDLCLFS